MTDAKIVVLGARGMLGTDLIETLLENGIQPQALDLPEFDITDSEQVKEAVTGQDIAINCAAYTNVEKAESEPELAYRINAEAVGNIGEIAKAAGAKVLHISTDFVFDGNLDRPYVETDPTNAISAYGKSKLAGEELLAEAGGHFCIIRIEWTYGNNGNNFVRKMIELGKTGKSLKVIDDQVGSPTATTEAARVICELLKNLPKGIFQFAADGYVSRYGMAQYIFEKLGMKVDLTSCKSSDFVCAAKRPLSSRFNCSKIAALLNEPIKPWQGPLEQFLEQL